MIDWESQWASFAENFYDGKAHIDLSRFGGGPCPLLLLPGPGFGDLSHPTTNLMLQLMRGRIEARSLIDIGCGSGILSLAGLLLNASSAIGIDIDLEAIEHARKNATLNRLNAQFGSEIPASDQKNHVLLMNMILPEQKIVMKVKTRLNALAGLWITSGILQTQREMYLELAQEWGWRLVEEAQRGEWIGMVFTPSQM